MEKDCKGLFVKYTLKTVALQEKVVDGGSFYNLWAIQNLSTSTVEKYAWERGISKFFWLHTDFRNHKPIKNLTAKKNHHTLRIWGFMDSLKSLMIMLEFLKFRMLINQLRCLSTKAESQTLRARICDWIRPDKDQECPFFLQKYQMSLMQVSFEFGFI